MNARPLIQLASAVLLGLLMVACGGGATGPDDEPAQLLAQGSSTAQGGSSDIGAAVLAAPVLGPTVTVPSPTVVDVLVHLQWQQQLHRDAVLEVSITPGGAATPPNAYSPFGLALSPMHSSSIAARWRISLPAGATALQAVVRVRALDNSGQASNALATFALVAQWQVHQAPASAPI